MGTIQSKQAPTTQTRHVEMFAYHCNPTAFAQPCAFRRRACPSPCWSNADAMLFLPVLFVLFGPLLATLAFKVVFFVLPMAVFFGGIKMLFKVLHDCDDVPFFGRFAEAPGVGMQGSGSTMSHAVAGGKCRGSTSESTDTYEILVPAPGVRPQDLQATVVEHTNILRVAGASGAASVEQSIHLPCDVDLDSIILTVSDGLVRIVIQKKQARTLHIHPATAHEDLASATTPTSTSGHGTPRAARRTIPIEPKQAGADESPAQPIKEDEADFVDVSQ